jgi:hypothetical protein
MRPDRGGTFLKVEMGLITLKLKERIIKNLEGRYRKTGTNDAVSWRSIWIELGATEEEFCKALRAAAETRGQAEVVFTDPDHIKLGSKVGFETKIRHASGVSSNTGASEQVYGLTIRFIRFCLHFVKEESPQV